MLIEEKICNIIMDITGNYELTRREDWKSDLTIIGLDSLMAIKLIVILEETFEVEFEDEYLIPEVLFDFYKLCDYIKINYFDNKDL